MAPDYFFCYKNILSLTAKLFRSKSGVENLKDKERVKPPTPFHFFFFKMAALSVCIQQQQMSFCYCTANLMCQVFIC